MATESFGCGLLIASVGYGKNTWKSNDMHLRKKQLGEEQKGAWRASKGDSEESIVKFDKAVENPENDKKVGTSH